MGKDKIIIEDLKNKTISLTEEQKKKNLGKQQEYEKILSPFVLDLESNNVVFEDLAKKIKYELDLINEDDKDLELILRHYIIITNIKMLGNALKNICLQYYSRKNKKSRYSSSFA